MGKSKGKVNKKEGKKRDKTFEGVSDTAEEILEANNEVKESTLRKSDIPSKLPKKIRGSPRESYIPYHKPRQKK